MKTRSGYVSNSSSTSFLIVYNDISAFECLKTEIGYEIMMKWIKNDATPTSDEISEFFHDLVESFANEYGESYYIMKLHPERKRLFYCSSVNWDLSEEIGKYCLGDDIDTMVTDFESSVKKIVENWGDNEEFYDWMVSEKLEDVIDMLVIQIVSAIEKKWKHVWKTEVEDSGDFGYYMEQKFMPYVISNCEGIAGSSINNH